MAMVVGSSVVIDATAWQNGATPIQFTKNGLLLHPSGDNIAVYKVEKIVKMDNGEMCQLDSGLWSPIENLIEVTVHCRDHALNASIKTEKVNYDQLEEI